MLTKKLNTMLSYYYIFILTSIIKNINVKNLLDINAASISVHEGAEYKAMIPSQDTVTANEGFMIRQTCLSRDLGEEFSLTTDVLPLSPPRS